MFYSEKSHKILEIRLILSFLFIICAFIQVGGQGQIISVSFAAYLMIWIYLGFDKLKPEDMTIPFLLMALSTFEFWNNDAIFLFILRALREYSVLILYISSRHFNKPINNSKSWAKAAIYFQYLCIGFSLLQLVSIVIGQPAFFLPYEWYGNISGDEIFSSESRITTVPSYWIEFGFQRSFVLGEEYKLRPVAFYTEPSYLASILLIIAFFVQSICFDNIKIIRYAYFLCLIGSLICQSGSGVLMTLLLGGYFELGKIKSAEKFMYGIIMFIIILIFIVIFVGERLFAIFDIVEEASGFIRLVLPFIRIRDLIGDGYFFGVPSGLFNEIFPPFYQGVEVGLGIDNSVFNLIMNYGFCGIIILGYVFKLMGAQASLFLFCVGQFNGALLGYDRAALVGFVLCQFYSNRSLLKINK